MTKSGPATHRENRGLWQTQYWFALHLISDVSHQRTAIRYLYRLFNQKNATQPGGLRARLIPNEGIITMSSTALGKRFGLKCCKNTRQSSTPSTSSKPTLSSHWTTPTMILTSPFGSIYPHSGTPRQKDPSSIALTSRLVATWTKAPTM